ncbi:hypothetical protein [Sulfidibacter corallicola]|uniref:Uncharacterized protein n=1 Tax=Sulfidibacter corallicola TaxID=2818388 RepID=A0A8A4TFJ0_SULCO|nr:hypothetical protein [Sulfidibacter corallicola]QTD47962.1 hypothetical protein J3U87_20440 [Sulfidibacter corallicola]
MADSLEQVRETRRNCEALYCGDVLVSFYTGSLVNANGTRVLSLQSAWRQRDDSVNAVSAHFEGKLIGV